MAVELLERVRAERDGEASMPTQLKAKTTRTGVSFQASDAKITMENETPRVCILSDLLLIMELRDTQVVDSHSILS
jgi:hypothetical protein